MADSKISDLAAVTGLIGTDEFVLARSGDTKKIAASDLATSFAAGSEMDYTQITSQVASITSETTIVTSGSFTADGTSAYLVEFFTPLVYVDTAAESAAIRIREDPAGANTDLGDIANVYSSAGGIQVPVRATLRITPSAGAHTYRVTARRKSGSGTVTVVAGAGGAGNDAPAYIRIIQA